MKIQAPLVNETSRLARAAGIVAPSQRKAAAPKRGARGVAPKPVKRALDTAVERTSAAPEATSRRIIAASKTGFVITPTEFERMMGLNDLVEESYLRRAILSAQPVMRIVVRSSAQREIGFATGVMVSPSLLLTNHHVFKTATEAAPSLIEANYVNDIRGVPSPSYRFRLAPGRYFFSNAALDWALVAVEPVSEDDAKRTSDFGYHRLIAQTGKITDRECITIIQHPGGQRRQYAIRENGFLKYHGDRIWYKSDTAPGSSGAPAFNDGFQIVGLHSSGAPKEEDGLFVLKDGSRVASLEGVEEDQIVWEANAGIRVSSICDSFKRVLPQGHELTLELYRAMDGGDVLSGGDTVEAPTESKTVKPPCAKHPDININVNVTGAGAQVDAASGGASVGIEKIPVIDRDYSSRKGYDTKWLGISVPVPTVTNKNSVVSYMDDGEHVVPYQNFSLVMSKKRRMAFFTIANVDGSPAARMPEAGRDYTRDGLGGLKESDSETWITDPRIPVMHQLPDRFYNKDRKSFDKGHIVQRDSVCWGKTYALVQRANGDTYHVTNCSPQTSQFNQGSRGVDNWGDLESQIMKNAKTQQLTVIAGPVFSEDDKDFHGTDDFGEVVVPIPSKYWKVIVENDNGKLKSYGFVLEQDLGAVPFEFWLPTTWEKKAKKISQIAKMIAPVKLPKKVVDAEVWPHPW